MLKQLLALIEKLYGKGAITKTIGTRTNVIKLPNNETKRYIKEELNIEAASDRLAKKAYEDIKELIPDIPKMNDQEILTLKGNLQRLDNKLNPPMAEVTEFGTKQKVSPEGIKTLIQEKGQVARPGTPMGKVESRVKQLESMTKEKGMTLDDIMKDVMETQKTASRMQDEGLVRAAVRYKMMDDLKRGTLKLPKNLEDVVRGASNEEDVITIFRTNYGEDALEQVDSLIPDFYNMSSATEAVKKIEQKFPNIKPKKFENKQVMDLDEAAKAEQENILTTTKEPYKPFGSDFTYQQKVDWLIKNVDPEAKVTIPHPDFLQHMLDKGRTDLVDHFWEIHTSNIGKKPTLNIDTSDLKNPELVRYLMEKEASKPKPVKPDRTRETKPKKEPEEPEDFATGGRVGFKFGSKKPKDLVKMAKKIWNDIFPTGDKKYDAQLVADELADRVYGKFYDELPQNVQLDLYGTAYDSNPSLKPMFKLPENFEQAMQRGMAQSREMESLGLDVTKSDDFFKYENMKLSGELGPEHQADAYKQKIRDEFSGVIDDNLMRKVEVDDDPQRLAEIYASIKEGLEMQKRGMSTDEIINAMKQSPKTKHATGGRVGYSDGTKPSAAENTPSQEIINRMIAQIKQLSKRGVDVSTIKDITGASDQMIKDVLGQASGGSMSSGLNYLMGY